jgi:glycosyltransferase involved in cell wall biosynthesis
MCVYKNDNPIFFHQALESMLSQTIKPLEIVIVCDGSLTEKLETILLDFKVKYSDLFKIKRLLKNIGFANALNIGIELTRTEYIARMDSDDISFPNRIEYQLKELIKNEELSIVGSYVLEFDKNISDARYIRNVPILQKDIFRVSKTRSPFNHPSVIFRKKDLVNAGMYKNIKRKEDLELFGRMMNKGYKGLNLNIPLLYYRSDINNYRRKKSIENLLNYIKVVYGFVKLKHSSFLDLLIVIFYQLSFMIFPVIFLKKITNLFFRIKTNK